MNTTFDTQPPLAGIRVIDFGHYIAGPLTGMLLADQGAEVIKIDRPAKPDYDTPANAVFNRGKKILQLNLKESEGQKTARKLIQSADVVIENFRPGVMKRLGLGAADMTTRNPRLIYLSLPGFFSTEREKACIRAFEGIVGAATGLFTDLHIIRRALEAPPVYTPVPVASAYGAIHGALAVSLALYAREETSRGDVIEVPLAGAAMSAMGAILQRVEKPPARYGRRPGKSLQTLRDRMKQADEAERQQLLREMTHMISPFFDSYQTSDGEWVHMLAVTNGRHSTRLLKALDMYEGLIADGMVDRPQYDDLTLTNNVQDTPNLSKEWKHTVRERMTAAFLEKPTAHWVEIMNATGVPFSVHRTTQAWLHAPEPEAAALTVTVDAPDYGVMRQFGVQTTLSRTPGEWFQPKPSSRGELDAILNDENRSSEHTADIELTPVSQKPILKGIRVLDLSTVLAGPCSARTLAEYGADVIKIDSPLPYFGPGVMCWSPIEVSQGKRSAILDLKTEEGCQIFRDLVKTADVVVHNFRPGVAEQLGIDYESVKQYKADIVYLSLTAYNGPKPGPWMNLPGFDPILQAATGVMLRYGGEGRRPELHGFASCIDYLTGYSGAFGVALSLFKRRRCGGGDLVLTSLAQGAQLVQAPFMFATETCQSSDEPQGQEAQGEHALQRIYQASDGWLFLAGLKSDVSKLRDIPALSNASRSIGAEAEDGRILFLEKEIQKQPVDFWVKAFNDAGLGCHRIDRIEDIRRTCTHEVTIDALDQWDDGRSISIIRMMDGPVGSPADTPSPTYARFKHTALKLGAPMPQLGVDTREILLELGYSNEQIDEWVSRGVVKEKFHEAYLPS